jgi:hypothetical protein
MNSSMACSYLVQGWNRSRRMSLLVRAPILVLAKLLGSQYHINHLVFDNLYVDYPIF